MARCVAVLEEGIRFRGSTPVVFTITEKPYDDTKEVDMAIRLDKTLHILPQALCAGVLCAFLLMFGASQSAFALTEEPDDGASDEVAAFIESQDDDGDEADGEAEEADEADEVNGADEADADDEADTDDEADESDEADVDGEADVDDEADEIDVDAEWDSEEDDSDWDGDEDSYWDDDDEESDWDDDVSDWDDDDDSDWYWDDDEDSDWDDDDSDWDWDEDSDWDDDSDWDWDDDSDWDWDDDSDWDWDDDDDSDWYWDDDDSDWNWDDDEDSDWYWDDEDSDWCWYDDPDWDGVYIDLYDEYSDDGTEWACGWYHTCVWDKKTDGAHWYFLDDDCGEYAYGSTLAWNGRGDACWSEADYDWDGDVLLQQADGSAVSEHLLGAFHDGGAGVAGADDGVGAEGLGFGDHASLGDFAPLVHHVGVALDLAAGDGLEAGHQIAADVLGSDDVSAHQPQYLNLLTGEDVACGDDHNGSFHEYSDERFKSSLIC